jgi:hypothetical protein
MNHVGLWNVYENDEIGKFVQAHVSSPNPRTESDDLISTCRVDGVKCDTMEKFNGMVQPYLSN